MRKCWEKKSADRPTFAELVPLLHTAVNRLCPDRSLIPQPQAAGDQAKPDVPKQPGASSQQPQAPPSLPKPAWQDSGTPPAKPATVVPSVKKQEVGPATNKQSDEQQGATVCHIFLPELRFLTLSINILVFNFP